MLSESEVIGSHFVHTPSVVDASSITEDTDHSTATLKDDIDFKTIVMQELMQRKGNDLPDACTYAAGHFNITWCLLFLKWTNATLQWLHILFLSL